MSSKNHSFTMSHNGDNDIHNEENEKKKVFVKEDNLRMLDEGVTEGTFFLLGFDLLLFFWILSLLMHDYLILFWSLAKTLIIRGNAEEANRHMFDLLQKVKENFDEAAVELLPAYYIMAEANIIMGGVRLK